MSKVSKILIVDDEAQIRGLLALAFKGAGYVVATAKNGRDAIASCACESFDVVLSDVIMPEINGHELAQWIAVHRPATRTALMSGFDAESRERPSSRACRLISKPFQTRQVVAFVDEVLAGQ